jgi:23S rRNA (adenine2503-C2)-methyltransferase
MQQSLFGLLPDDFQDLIPSQPKFRRTQLFEWVQRGIYSFDEMTNIPKSIRESLETDGWKLFDSTVIETHVDEDGTSKIAIRLSDSAMIEAVLLTDEQGRKTACLSCQVGCAMGCAFCRTGTMGLIRNLSASEIVQQFYHLQNQFGGISHIVYMGMGEPFANYDEVIQSINILHHEKGANISVRRITVSTSGILPGINRLAKEGPHVRLALSLTSADNALRSELMPINYAYPLPELHRALRTYQEASGRRITLEYVLLGDINDTKEHARQVVEFAKGLNVMVNVIPWNPAAELDFKQPSAKRINEFTELLSNSGLSVTRRYRRGRGVNGACGQLASQQHSQ